eukprot:TRINITY_DN3545_c0_g1_i1.p1 TRINITY_DN3545_c0_g1~~TRINITY_DN3545_c0_g1_i1.p1  ORF type:complete len:253 (-),score=54.89 TRINITY_DN3545_c0_g1_i1:352-1110(-)
MEKSKENEDKSNILEEEGELLSRNEVEWYNWVGIESSEEIAKRIEIDKRKARTEKSLNKDVSDTLFSLLEQDKDISAIEEFIVGLPTEYLGVKNQDGLTPLHIAVRNTGVETVKFLFNHLTPTQQQECCEPIYYNIYNNGFSRRKMMDISHSPLDYAIRYGRAEVALYLFSVTEGIEDGIRWPAMLSNGRIILSEHLLNNPFGPSFEVTWHSIEENKRSLNIMSTKKIMGFLLSRRNIMMIWKRKFIRYSNI